MRLYNTMTRSKQDFVPYDGRHVRMYACGPTVYNFFHIGNARCFVLFDFLRRYLEYRGFQVTFVQNFTDIDDKMIKRAQEMGVSVQDVAERYIAEYFTDAKGLGVQPATIHPRATENMEEIVAIITALCDGGYAYPVAVPGAGGNCDVYFSTKKFADYGKLSHIKLEDLESGARVEVSDWKKDPLDFALWKAQKPGEPSWDSPWGKGRPGWHIECTAMAKKYLGGHLDLHCGGKDLAFPHHENEIAQSECFDRCCGIPNPTFARFWLHNGYINVDGAKMSKSGTFFTVRDAAQAYGYDAVRFFLVSAHYRSPVNYTNDALEQARNALTRLYTCRDSLVFRIGAAGNGTGQENEEGQARFRKQFAAHKQKMCEALDDDFNTADGIAAVFDLTRDINIALAEPWLSRDFLTSTLALYDELLSLFGFSGPHAAERPCAKAPDGWTDQEIEQRIARRAEAKKAKDYPLADAIRDELKDGGILLEDTPQGVKWRRA